ncbi:Redoxin [Paxillus ammoniavirescens]|nr:Redoxin [Paxillus ammoniavirescens]
MASFIAGAARAAHSAAATILSVAQITAGEEISVKSVKEDDPEKTLTLDLTGKNIILGVPGAFTPSCSSQVPQYIADYDKYKEKGVNDIYVVAVNDAFVMKAWKEKLAPQGTGVRFIADDRGAFTSGLGLLFDATDLLGSPRSKRHAIVVQDGKVEYITVEDDPAMVTTTASKGVLAQLA